MNTIISLFNRRKPQPGTKDQPILAEKLEPQPEALKILYHVAMENGNLEGMPEEIEEEEPYLQWIREAVADGWQLANGPHNSFCKCELMTRSLFAVINLCYEPSIYVRDMHSGEYAYDSTVYTNQGEIRQLIKDRA